eukprot:TRINITY_DN20176_c0_g1_i1.p1 TRINITY_DN20176_c0_g1~~TRINITY_DN20176_c0_g1_i1.p1  ORF type:complete len:300 (+),score=63.85 TRINITY_DN20176_c0_g1_i1:23-901(+)
MSSRVVVITGASEGLGLFLAVCFAQHGDTVYATMRDIIKGEENVKTAANNANVTIHTLQLDVLINESVERCVQDIMEKEGKIDIMINNAGGSVARNIEQLPMDQIQWIMDVNYMGTVRVTRAVLPFMRKARSGHIINISSLSGLVGTPFHELYCGAKFAIEGFTESLASYVTPQFNVKFTLIEPGNIKTDMADKMLKRLGDIPDDDYKSSLQAYLDVMGKMSASAQSCDEVCQVVLGVTLSSNPPFRTRTSPGAEKLVYIKTAADPTGLELVNAVSSIFGQTSQNNTHDDRR